MEEFKKKRMYGYLMMLSVAGAIGLQGWRTLFNNYGVDIVGINGFQLGVIQSVREVPGFLSLLVVFVLYLVKEHKLSAISMILVGLGCISVPMFPSFFGLVCTIFFLSLGFHFFETTNKSLVLQYFDEKESPIVLARQKSITSITNICVGLGIFALSYFVPIEINFIVLGAIVFIIGIYALRFNPSSEKVVKQRKGILVKKEYWLYYIINLLSGARRQIFVVFSVFLLVQKFHYSVIDITILFVINNVVTYFVSPFVAKLINKYGEKPLLSIEYTAMIFVFLGYAYFKTGIAISILYIIDNIFYNCALGINTYFQKIAKREDIAPSMAFGFTVNHIAAVVIPVIGGLLWYKFDYRIPFVAGAFLSVVSLFFVRKMKNTSSIKN